MIELPDINYASRIADWIELQVLFSGHSISKNKVASIVSEHSTDYDESKIDSAIQELVRRWYLYGDVKPYTITNNIVSPNFAWRKYPEYTLCLIFSTHGASNSEGGTKLFERLTKSYIDYYYAFESTIFGFPNQISFKEQVHRLAEGCNEKKVDDPTQFDKDRGADIVAWKSFGDNRNCHLYLLVQCAAGGKWRDKKPVPIASWRRYIGWNHLTAVPAIAIAQIVESEKWQNAVDDYGLIIDRARIFRTISSGGYSTEPLLRSEISEWCNGKLSQ